MKKIIIALILITCSTITMNAQQKLEINTSKSELKWYGYHTFYFGGHNGTVDFKQGHFIKTNDKITGGSFTIDMNTLVNTDGGYMKGLVNHLKNEDFFNVKKHPLAHLVITNVTYHDATHMQVKANLTVKGITKPIRFQAQVNFEKSQMTTKFKIDRTRWGITYNSKIKNSAISEAIGFEVTLSL